MLRFAFLILLVFSISYAQDDTKQTMQTMLAEMEQELDNPDQTMQIMLAEMEQELCTQIGDMAMDDMHKMDSMADKDMADKDMLEMSMSVEDLTHYCTKMSKDTGMTDRMTDTMTDTVADGMAGGMAKMEDAMMAHDLAPWQTLELVDARSGESFTLGDYVGKTVFVEPMATWCSNCRKQFQNLNSAKAELAEQDANNYKFIALSIEGNLAPERLAQYANREGFDITFAVASAELLQALVADFGRSITSPPSTPHFIIRPDNTVTSLETGLESSDQLLAQLLEAAQAAMMSN